MWTTVCALRFEDSLVTSAALIAAGMQITVHPFTLHTLLSAPHTSRYKYLTMLYPRTKSNASKQQINYNELFMLLVFYAFYKYEHTPECRFISSSHEVYSNICTLADMISSE